MQNRRNTLSDKTFIQLSRLCLYGLFILLISACAPSVTKDISRSETRVLPVEDSSGLPTVIQSLIAQADTQTKQQHYNDALATLERAVRIKPRYPEVWSRMALVYMRLHQFPQARQHAERSNSYIKDNQALRSFNDELIEFAINNKQMEGSNIE